MIILFFSDFPNNGKRFKWWLAELGIDKPPCL
jgi:hypothetical protein